MQPLFMLGSSSKKEDEERASDNESKNNIDKESVEQGYEVKNLTEQHFSIDALKCFLKTKTTQ